MAASSGFSATRASAAGLPAVVQRGDAGSKAAKAQGARKRRSLAAAGSSAVRHIRAANSSRCGSSAVADHEQFRWLGSEQPIVEVSHLPFVLRNHTARLSRNRSFSSKSGCWSDCRSCGTISARKGFRPSIK